MVPPRTDTDLAPPVTRPEAEPGCAEAFVGKAVSRAKVKKALTAEFLNRRFEQSYDRDSHTDNAILGANYLAWLTKYFGDVYFEDNYDLSAGKCKRTKDMCLLNMVISAYNYGHGPVDDAYDTDKPLPNPGYINGVRKLMTTCDCLKY